MNEIPDNITDYLASEKMDGVRSFWTGSEFITRHGNILSVPAWFKAGMPSVRLDGELFTKRGDFDGLVSAIQRKRNPWESVTFQIFDLAQLRQPIEARLTTLATLTLPPHCQIVPHRPLVDLADLDAMESEIVAQGGEGVCIRPPGSYYSPNGFTKIKRIFPDLQRWQG